jgi:hypothetical protein
MDRLATTRLRRVFVSAALVLAIMLGARPATSRPLAVPSPANSSVPDVIVGSWNGLSANTSPTQCAPPFPGFEVVVRDFNNQPIAGSTVMIRFAGSGVRPHAVQNPGITVFCATGDLSRVTNAVGSARFPARLAGFTLAPSIGVFADGVQLRQVPGLSPDYDRSGLVDLNDFSTFATDFLNTNPQPRSDFDNCLGMRLADYSFFSVQFIACLGQPAATLCP